MRDQLVTEDEYGTNSSLSISFTLEAEGRL